MKKFVTFAAFGVAAAACLLATPGVSEAGWHYGRGCYTSYRHHGYYHRGWNSWARYHRVYCSPLPACYREPAYCPPAPVACVDNRARINLCVPANACVQVDGQATTQTGRERTFESPPLEAGKEFVYDITARWNAPDGTPVVRTQQVTVRANATVDVAF